MTKSELIAKTAEKSGISKAAAEQAVNGLIDVVTEALVNGEKVTITGFGTFETRQRKERVCINPKTLEKIKVEANVVAGFKPGSALKNAVSK